MFSVFLSYIVNSLVLFCLMTWYLQVLYTYQEATQKRMKWRYLEQWERLTTSDNAYKIERGHSKIISNRQANNKGTFLKELWCLFYFRMFDLYQISKASFKLTRQLQNFLECHAITRLTIQWTKRCKMSIYIDMPSPYL